MDIDETKPRSDAPSELLAAFERFALPVREEGECWSRRVSLTEDGYSRVWVGGKWRRAHVYAYQVFIGPIEWGEDVHHTCGNRYCVRPSHLETKDKRRHIAEHNHARAETRKLRTKRQLVNARNKAKTLPVVTDVDGHRTLVYFRAPATP